MRPAIRIVEQSPESRLRDLLAEEDALRAQLRRNHDRQRQARRDYADAHGLLILPSMAKIREVLG